MLLKLTSSALLLLPLTQASTFLTPPSSYTLLAPCGRAASSFRPIIPDSTCQQISSSGAFVVASLGHLGENVRIGFSTTPDCKQTYTPTIRELEELQRNQTCRTFFTEAPGSTTGAEKEGYGTPITPSTLSTSSTQGKRDVTEENEGSPMLMDPEREYPQPDEPSEEELERASQPGGAPIQLETRSTVSEEKDRQDANPSFQYHDHPHLPYSDDGGSGGAGGAGGAGGGGMLKKRHYVPVDTSAAPGGSGAAGLPPDVSLDMLLAHAKPDPDAKPDPRAVSPDPERWSMYPTDKMNGQGARPEQYTADEHVINLARISTPHTKEGDLLFRPTPPRLEAQPEPADPNAAPNGKMKKRAVKKRDVGGPADKSVDDSPPDDQDTGSPEGRGNDVSSPPHKRNLTHEKHHGNNKRASTVAAQRPMDSTQAAKLLAGEIPLMYVMLVNA